MLQVTLLGTGGTLPLPGRALSSCAVQAGGSVVLLDCGEGTQTACRRQHVSLYKTDCICLTHYHGDHIFGLPGYLQSMGSLGRTAPVTIFGPKGLAQVMEHILWLCRGLPFPVVLRELAEDAAEFPLPGTGGLLLSAFAAQHRVPCVGYRLRLPRAGRFDPAKAAALGVPQAVWKRLQNGEAVPLAGGEVVQPGQVLGAPRQGLCVVFSTDTRPCAALEAAAQGADLLVCDATYDSDSDLPKAIEWGHSTYTESAALAARAGAKRLWLSHFSAAIEEPAANLPAAQAIFPAAEVGEDGKALLLKFPER